MSSNVLMVQFVQKHIMMGKQKLILYHLIYLRCAILLGVNGLNCNERHHFNNFGHAKRSCNRCICQLFERDTSIKGTGTVLSVSKAISTSIKGANVTDLLMG